MAEGARPTQPIVAALSASPVLGKLAPDVLERMAARGGPVEIEAGAVLFQSGEPGDAAYAVLSGELEIRTSALDGQQLRFTTLGPGALVGEMAVLDGGLRSADVVGARKTRLWRIPRQALTDVLMEEPASAMAVIAELSRRLRAANAAMEAERRMDLGGRVAALILAERNGQGLAAITQTEIARRLAFSRERVNRKLNDWGRMGWVRLGARGIEVLDEDSLQALAQPR